MLQCGNRRGWRERSYRTTAIAPPLACDSGAGSALWLAAKGSASARAASDATAEAYFNHSATLSSAQMASTGWRVRTTADCLPWTSTSVGSEREL